MARRRFSFFILLGPAFAAAIGYVDPGNFATNLEAGSVFGYRLLWVVLLANLGAMLVQFCSAKLGAATGKNLGECIRDCAPPWLAFFYWVQVEIIAMMTDLAETLGGALGFKLLFHLSLLNGFFLTAAISYVILYFSDRNIRWIEWITGAFLLFIVAIFIAELWKSSPQWGNLLHGLTVPSVPNAYGAYLAAGIVGATIMPHVIYLHSALATRLHGLRRPKKLRRGIFLDVVLAMAIAGFVNLAMLAVSASTFFLQHAHTQSLTDAYLLLAPALGKAAAVIFALALIASGLSSTAIGTLTGQIMMESLVHFTIPLWLRRTLTLSPALVVILLRWSPTEALIFSQYVLSLGILFAVIPLISFARNRKLMGALVNGPVTTAVLSVVILVVLLFNGLILIHGV